MNAPVHPCHRGKSHKQSGWTTRPAWDSIEFSWLSCSDETHIHDRGQILKKGLLPNHLGPTPTSHSFVDKIVCASLPIAATKLRSLPPVQTKDLGQTCSKLRTQFLLRCLQVWSREPTPVLFMISHHSAFRHRLAACPGWEESFRATCPARPYTAVSALCHRDGRFNLHRNTCATERLGLYDFPAYSGATWFPGRKQAVEFCRRNPATHAPQDT